MPCRCYEAEDEARDREHEKARKARVERQRIEELLNKQAALLCFICTNLPEKTLIELYKLPTTVDHLYAGAELKKWWTKHQEDDRKEAARVAKIAADKAKAQRRLDEIENMKQAALNKLTPADRKALGLG